MTRTEELALQEAIKQDPRVQQVVQERRSGRIVDADLRALGYDVPAGYSFAFGGRSGYGTLLDNKRSLMEKAVPIISILGWALRLVDSRRRVRLGAQPRQRAVCCGPRISQLDSPRLRVSQHQPEPRRRRVRELVRA